jgi:uncharacterized membrane protein
MPWLFALEKGFNLGDFQVAETIANAIEVLAIIAIAASVLVAILGSIAVGVRFSWATGFITFKKYMGRGLLIGLDLLIAGDIIKMVTLEPTIENATVLGLLVLIRTFLSWAIILEVGGRVLHLERLDEFLRTKGPDAE